MKRYKRIIPSTLVIATLMSSIATEDTFATTRAEYSNDGTDVSNNTNSEVNSIETITTGSAVEITTDSVVKNVNPRATGTFTDANGWTYSYDTITKEAKIIQTIDENKVGDVVIPSSVTIGGEEYAVTVLDHNLFQESTELTSVIIPEGVTEVGMFCFADCSSLAEVTFPKSLTKLGLGSFSYCAFTEITVPGTLTEFGIHTFQYNPSLKKATILEGAKFIDHYIFAGCELLEEVVIPEGVTDIGYFAFKECRSLKEVKLPSTVEVIGYNAFKDSGIRYIQIPANVTTIDEGFIESVVSTETTEPITAAYINTPLTGKEIPIDSIDPEDAIGNTLYMKYDITPEIDLNGGEMGADRTFPAWATAEQLSDYLDTPYQDGEVFDKWEVVEADIVIGADGSKYIAGSVKLKAKWAVSKDVTFNVNGDSIDTIVITQTEGENYILPEEPTKEGYDFVGWFDVDGNEITEDTVVENLEDNLVIDAKWEKIEEPTKPEEKPDEPTDEIENPDLGEVEETPETEEKPEPEEKPEVEEPVETDTDDDTYYYNNDTVDSVKTDVNTKVDATDNVGNTSGDEVEKALQDLKNVKFYGFSVKHGSDEFITRYADGTIKRRNSSTKNYIDPTTKSMYVSIKGVLENAIDPVELKWNPTTKSAEIYFINNGTKIAFKADSSIMTVNGVEREMFSGEGEVVKAQLVNGRLMMPLRYVSELFGFNVVYDNAEKSTIVYTVK